MIVVEYRLTGIEVLTRTQVINAVKRALVRIGEYWHEAFAWKRFTVAGAQEYGFKPRKLSYNRKKARKFGEALPLFFSGETSQLLLSDDTRRRITSTRDKVTIPMPTNINQYKPNSGISIVDEIRKISRAELNILQDNLVVLINEELDKEVPANLRNRGFSGGHVQSLKLTNFRAKPNANPVERRAAA